VEAIHMANLLCQHGYFFPVGECNKNLSVKDDSSLYRFQVNTHKNCIFFPFSHPSIHPSIRRGKQTKEIVSSFSFANTHERERKSARSY
jgi:hypothetical protein